LHTAAQPSVVVVVVLVEIAAAILVEARALAEARKGGLETHAVLLRGILDSTG